MLFFDSTGTIPVSRVNLSWTRQLFLQSSSTALMIFQMRCLKEMCIVIASLTHSLTHSLPPCSLTHSLIHTHYPPLLTHSLIHTHPLVPSLTLSQGDSVVSEGESVWTDPLSLRCDDGARRSSFTTNYFCVCDLWTGGPRQGRQYWSKLRNSKHSPELKQSRLRPSCLNPPSHRSQAASCSGMWTLVRLWAWPI